MRYTIANQLPAIVLSQHRGILPAMKKGEGAPSVASDLLAPLIRKLSERKPPQYLLAFVAMREHGGPIATEIQQNLSWINERTDNSMDVLFLGWEGIGQGSPTFSAQAFNECCKGLESICCNRWKYSGGTDIVVGTVEKRRGKARILSLSSAYSVNLETAISSNIAPNAIMFLNMIFSYAEKTRPTTLGLSNAMGRANLVAAIKHAIIAMVPSFIHQDIDRAFLNTTKDLGRIYL